MVCPVTGRTVRLVWFAAEPVQPEQERNPDAFVLMRKPGEEVVLRDRDGQEIRNIRIVNVR